MDYIERALNTAYSGGIEALVDAQRTESGNITGRFIGTEGKVYAYQIDPEGIEFEESHEDSEWINDYYTAKLDAEGVDYHGDSAYEYWMGRQGVPIRRDGLQCKTGTPCGNRCIPKGHKCRVGSSGASGAALKQGGSKLKTGLKIAAVVGAAGAAGALRHSMNKATLEKARKAGIDPKAGNKQMKSAKAPIAMLNPARNSKPETVPDDIREGLDELLNSQEEKPPTRTVPVDETITKKKVSGKVTTKRPVTSRSQRKRSPGIGG